MLKISSRNVEKLCKNTKKGPTLVLRPILIGSFLLNLWYSNHPFMIMSTILEFIATSFDPNINISIRSAFLNLKNGTE